MNRAKKELLKHIQHKINELFDKSIIDDIDYVIGDGSKVNNYIFTSCDDCKHKINGIFQEECISCKRYYGCHFEKKEILSNIQLKEDLDDYNKLVKVGINAN